MSREIRIEISDKPSVDIVHRFRNFGEDVYRALKDSCNVDLGEIDKATTAFTVRGVHRRDVRRITKIIEKQLEIHNFANTAKLSCLSSAESGKA